MGRRAGDSCGGGGHWEQEPVAKRALLHWVSSHGMKQKPTKGAATEWKERVSFSVLELKGRL